MVSQSAIVAMKDYLCFTTLSAGNVVTSSGNLSTTPIVMSAQKLQLKTVKAPGVQQQQPQQQQQLQQQQHRILNQQSTATVSSQTLPSPNQVQVQQQQQQQQQLQHIQIAGRATTASGAISQRTLTALAAAKQQQQQQQQAAVNRRRSTTDATK